MTITTVGLDADDTLWHNETIFRLSQKRFVDLLADHADEPVMMGRLAEVERRNLRLYGYGVKGFTLSMLETAMELCDGAAPPHLVREILAAGREMLAYPVETLPGVDEALAELSEKYRLVLITKGDLMDQERKIAASGLAERFAAVQILADKTPEAYARVLMGQGVEPARFLMAGNSMRSDVIPVLDLGGTGVFIPHDLTWSHEHADAPDHPRLHQLADMGGLPALIAALEEAA